MNVPGEGRHSVFIALFRTKCGCERQTVMREAMIENELAHQMGTGSSPMKCYPPVYVVPLASSSSRSMDFRESTAEAFAAVELKVRRFKLQTVERAGTGHWLATYIEE